MEIGIISAQHFNRGVFKLTQTKWYELLTKPGCGSYNMYWEGGKEESFWGWFDVISSLGEQ